MYYMIPIPGMPAPEHGHGFSAQNFPKKQFSAKKIAGVILFGLVAILGILQIHKQVSAIATTIAVMSDGGGSTAQQMIDDLDQILLQKLSGWNIDAVGWNGDIGYDTLGSGTSSVAFAVGAYDSSTAGVAGIPLFLAEGNHEAENAADVLRLRQMYTRYQGYATSSVHGPLGWNFSQMPNAYSSTTNYAYDIGDIRVIVVNQYAATTSDAVNTTGRVHEQVFEWIKSEIKKTTKQHIAVMAHEPAYPVPSQVSGNHIGDSLDADPANRDKFVNLLASYGQINHFVGHTHIADLYEMKNTTAGVNGDARTTTTSLDGGIWELDSGGFGDKAPGGGGQHTYPGIGYLHTNSANWGDYTLMLVYGEGSPQWAAPTSETVGISNLTRQILVNTWQGAGTGTSSNGLFDMSYYVDYTDAVAANPDWSANNSGKWWEPAFSTTTAGWTSGELGVGYRTDAAAPQWINKPIDAFGGLATTTPQVYSIMQRIVFPATTTSSYGNMTLHLDDDDGVMVWLNGTLILNSTNASVTAPTTGSGAEYFDKVQTNTSNGWVGTSISPTFSTVDISAFKGSLVNGQNTLVVWNINGGSSTSTDLGVAVRLSISGAVDAIAPNISSVASTTPTVNTATVSWTTNESSDSQVEYGLTSTYTASTTLDTNMVTSHSVNISGLATSTTYHFRVISKDASANRTNSTDYTFTTPASTPSAATTTLREGQNGYTGMTDTYLNASSTYTNNGTATTMLIDGAAPFANGLMKWDVSSIPSNATIQSVSISYNVTNNSGANTYTIYKSTQNWVENETNWASSSVSVPWGLPGSLDNSDDYVDTSLGTLGTASIAPATSTLNAAGIAVVQGWVSGSTPNQGFFISRTSTADIDGLQFDSSEAATVGNRPGLTIVYNLPSGPDITAPVVSAVASSTTASAATITWTTNEAATSTIDFGTTSGYGTASSSATATTSHRIVISGLASSTLYHYRISVWDTSGNLATTSDLTFTTTAPDTTAPSIVGNVASSTTSSSGTITWTTDEAASSRVVYGTSTGTYTASSTSATATTSHSHVLSGLLGSTPYYFRVVSTDASLNTSTSSEMIFTTSGGATTVSLREGQNSYSGMVDTYLDSAAVTTNQGTNVIVAIDGSPALTGLMKWDLSSIPSSATVSDVKLVYNVTNITANTYNIYRSLRAWTEGGATWNTYDGTNSWGTVGGLNATSDYNSTSLGTVGVNSLGLATTTLNASGITLVQGWVDGSITNNGFTLHQSASTDSVQFDSSEGLTTALRPALVVTYSTGGPDTTPPVISSVASSTTETTSTITWNTDESATTAMVYGTVSGTLGTASSSASTGTTHSLVLTGLAPATTYYFRVVSTDGSANTATSSEFSFRTVTPEATSTAWWNASWGKRIPVTFDNVGHAENLTNFPVRVVLNSSRITYGDFKANGDDIRFVDADGATVLQYEIENWDTASTSNIWVKVPQVNSASSNDFIYMYYNNPAASAAATTTGVWDSNYKGVWHLGQNPAGTAPQMLDSTINAKHATTAGSMTADQRVLGQSGFAVNLTGNDYLSMGALGAMAGGRTVSMWINGNSWTRTDTGDNALFAFNTSAGGNTDIVRISTAGSIGHYNGTTVVPASSSVAIATGGWHHISIVSSSTANASLIYQDGVLVGTAATWAPAVGATDVFFAGQEIDTTTASDFFNGKQDEIRVESAARTAKWIQAQFETQEDSFITYGSAESGADTTPPVISSIASSTATSTASITWSTNEVATSTVQYGLTTSYGSQATSSGTTTHSVSLSSLTPNTLYHYRVTAIDASTNLSTSTDITFTTTAITDTTPPVISDIASSTSTSTASITWSTDEAATSTVQYGLTTSYGSQATSSGTSTHSVSLSSLTPNTLYHYRVTAIDSSTNTSTSSDRTFTTTALPDTTAPTISAVASTTGVTTATITYTTNEAASSTIDYGLTTGYGSQATSSGTTSHSVSLSGLTSSTLYHYRITATDSSGNASSTTDLTFTTTAAPDVTPPAVELTAPAASALVTGSSVTLTASSSDGVGVAGVKFYVDNTLIQSEDTSFPYTLSWDSTSVASGTRILIAVARDSAGNQATSSPVSVTVDNAVPVISNIASSSAQTTASISFTTNENTTVRVNYGLTSGYGSSTAFTSTASTTHTVALTGLNQNTAYHFQIEVRDAVPFTATSTDRILTTTPDVTAPVISTIGAVAANTSGTISWVTDEAASSQVTYGLLSRYDQITAKTDTSPRVTDHSVSITGLSSCAVYSYKVISQDTAGNTSTSSATEFVTTGCTGGAAAGANEEQQIATSTGGNVELIQGGEGIGLNIPAGFSSTSSSTVFQILQVNAAAVANGGGAPAPGMAPVDTYMFRLNALTAINTVITSFDAEITITITYSDADVAGFDESTLKMYRYDGSSWHELDDCVLNTTLNTITCTTTRFSDFGMFGIPIPGNSGSAPVTVAPGSVAFTTGTSGGLLAINQNALGCQNGAIFNVYSGQRCPSSIGSVPTGTNSGNNTSGNFPNIPANFSFTKLLTPGMTHPDILHLQRVLNADKTTRVAIKGIGSQGKEIDYFGPGTKQAVIKFQIKYGVIKNAKDPYAGTTGPGTRAALNRLLRK